MNDNCNLDRFFDLHPDLLCVGMPNGFFTKVNPAFTQLLGWSEAEMLSRPNWDFLHPDDIDPTLQAINQLNSGETVIAFENRYRCKNGEYKTFAWTAYPDMEEKLMYAVGRDITADKQVSSLLKQSEARFKAITDHVPLGIFVTSISEGGCIYTNESYQQMTGRSNKDLKGKGWSQAIHPEDRMHVYSGSNLALKRHQVFHAEFRFLRPDKTELWSQIYAAPIHVEGVLTGYVGVVEDIRSRKDSESRLRFQAQLLEQANIKLNELASTDELTNLNNRRGVGELLGLIISRMKREKSCLSLILLDIDHFKRFNDQHGHLAGDQVLKNIAHLINQSVRECDVTGRFGGEEFVVLLPDADRESALQVAERCRHCIEQHVWEKGPISASFGVATLEFNSSTHSLDTVSHEQIQTLLVQKADEALYDSKAQGRNRVTHYQSRQSY